MSLQNRRFAPDGETYTHAWLARYCTDGFAQMRETATATEHSHSRSSQSSDVLPEWRIAADNAYQRWETATATEHSHSRSSQSSDVLPERRIAADNADQRWETATATEHSHSRMYSHDEWRNMRLKCKWCSIEGQCLSFTDVDPYGPLCDRCYDAARPPRFSYVDMVLRPFLGTLPEVCNLVAEYAYRSCADFLDWQKHMCNNRYVPEIHD